MHSFSMNGYFWDVQFVEANDPMLMDRTGKRALATTDPKTHRVYISKDLYGDLQIKVLLHELGHCALTSFHLLDDIHRMVKPEYWIEAEEWACNLIADYGFKIFGTAFNVLGYKSLELVPEGLNDIIYSLYLQQGGVNN